MIQPKTLRQDIPVRMSDLLIGDRKLTKELKSGMTNCRLCGCREQQSVITGLCGRCFRRQAWEAMPADEREDCVRRVVHKRYLGATLDTLAEGLRRALTEADPGESIFLWGRPGTGKTWTFAALARQRITEGHRVVRETWERLCLRIRDTYKTNSRDTEWSIIEPLCEADTLILEDLGTVVSAGRQESDFSLKTLLVVLDSRSEDKLQTCITSNKPLEEIEKSFDPRIASRLRQGTIIHKTGDDQRGKSHA